MSTFLIIFIYLPSSGILLTHICQSHLPYGFSQRMEHCTSNRNAMDSSPIQAWLISGLFTVWVVSQREAAKFTNWISHNFRNQNMQKIPQNTNNAKQNCKQKQEKRTAKKLEIEGIKLGFPVHRLINIYFVNRLIVIRNPYKWRSRLFFYFTFHNREAARIIFKVTKWQ